MFLDKKIHEKLKQRNILTITVDFVELVSIAGTHTNPLTNLIVRIQGMNGFFAVLAKRIPESYPTLHCRELFCNAVISNKIIFWQSTTIKRLRIGTE